MKNVYVDVVFAVNFCVDFLLMMLTLKFLNVKISFLKITVASVVGGMYSVLASIVPLGVFTRILTLLVAILIMLFLTLSLRSIKTYIKAYLLYYAFSFLLCGAVNMIISVFEKENIGVLFLLACTALMCAFVSDCGKILKTDIVSIKAEVVIEQSGKRESVVLLCDSGNLLTDPYTGKPVILLDIKWLDKFDLMLTRFVPITTVSGSTLIEVFTPDVVYVGKKMNKKIDVAVGFVKAGFNSREYDGIISNRLLAD